TGVERVAPDRDGCPYARLDPERDRDLAMTRGAEHEVASRERRLHEDQARLRALRDEAPLLVDDHPAPVVLETGRDGPGLGDRDASCRLHRVDVDARQAQAFMST